MYIYIMESVAQQGSEGGKQTFRSEIFELNSIYANASDINVYSVYSK